MIYLPGLSSHEFKNLIKKHEVKSSSIVDIGIETGLDQYNIKKKAQKLFKQVK